MREDTDRGFSEFGGNELTVGSTIDDPAALRVASPRGINKISGNVLAPDGKTQFEKTLLVLTQDESGGCYDFQAQLPGRTDDKGMVRLARLSPAGFELFVPIIQNVMPPVPPAPPDGSDPTHGIPEGDFTRIFDTYGFASDWQDVYIQGRVTWVQVIQRQDERDDYWHFPKTPAPPPVMTPEERLQRVLDVQAAREEFFPMDLDDDKVQAYLAGRSSLIEFHNDNVDRAGAHRPEFHRPGRPY
jgi:hypothetical protein